MIVMIRFLCVGPNGKEYRGGLAIRHFDLESAWSLLHAKLILEARRKGSAWFGRGRFRLCEAREVIAAEAFHLGRMAYAKRGRCPLPWELISVEPEKIVVSDFFDC